MQIPDFSGFNPPPRGFKSTLLLSTCWVLLIAFGCLLVAADVLGHEEFGGGSG